MNKSRALLTGAGVWVWLSLFVMPTPAQNRVAEVIQAPRTLVIAHRGYSGLAPENTLPAFELALSVGVDLVELDTHPSRDGVPMVIHDATLDRTTDAVERWGRTRIPVRAHTANELQALDAGRWFHARYAGTRLPTLLEALQTVRAAGGCVLVECKEGDAETLASLIRAHGFAERVVMQSFNWEFLAAFHTRAPEVQVAALGPPSRLVDGTRPDHRPEGLGPEWLAEARRTGARLVVWSQKHLTRAGVEAAVAQGFRVWAYTANTPEQYEALRRCGVHGIITDHPGRLWRWLALRQWTPEGSP
ncbi:glycerophosphodiester phosphodiesterase [Limisphaera sp. VF-2]|jgi:glycerophosphoryl diester phosphodiesterase|uniref:glycerophosphodiester phosphodiesterase n=1 Tax=Limisphaera sp. VF-2 TaxID=3400418 RepID=UPI00176FEB35|nr:glycerophosphodiester phosphodiesterase family protein [Limisphaera sp.]